MKKVKIFLFSIIFIAFLFLPCIYAQQRVQENINRPGNDNEDNIYNIEKDRCFLLIEKNLEQNKYQAAQKILDDFSSKYPEQNERKYYFFYALVEECRNEYAKAEEYYIKAIDIFPDYTESMNSLGSLYLKTGELKKSEAQLLKAVRLNPYSPFINFNAGQLYYKTGRFDLAEKFFNKACQLKMNYGEAYTWLGLVMLGREDYIKAAYNFNKALELNCLAFETHYYLGLAYHGAGRAEDAIGSMEKSIGINKGFYKGMIALGKIYQDRKEYAKAIKYYQMAEPMIADDIDLRISIAECYYNMKRYDDSSDILENLTGKDPGNKRIDDLLRTLRDNRTQ